MGINKNNENLESKESLSKKTWVDLKWKFLWQFWKKILDSWDKMNFINEVISKNSISDSELLKAKLEEFKSYSNDRDINNFNISELTIYDLKKIVWKDFLKLNNFRNQLKTKIVWNYMISDKDYLDIFKWRIDNLNENQLNNFINSEKQLDIFVNSVFWSSVLKRKDLFPINFLNLSESDKQARYDRLNDNEKKLVIWIVKDINNWRFVETDIRLLFSTNFLEKSEKEILIKTFIPNISLQKALDFWIINEEKADSIKTKVIDKILIENPIGLDIVEIINKMSYEDFIVDINEINLNTSNILKLADKIWFKNAETDFIQSKEEFEKELIEEWPQNLEELIKWLKLVNKNSKFNNLEKFKENNIIQFKKKNEHWEEQINYVKIVKTDDDKKELRFLTVWRWNFIDLKSNWKENNISYLEFLNNLSSKELKIDLFTEKEIKKNIKDPKNLDFVSSNLELFNEEDLLNASDEEKQWYINYYKEKTEKDLLDLEDKLKQKWWKKEDNPLLSLQIDEKKEELENIKNWLTNNDKILSFLNKSKFIEKINEVDPDWKKNWFKIWIQFVSKWVVYTVSGFEDDWITLSRRGWIEWPIDFTTFYEVFKENKGKRLEFISDFDSLININKSDNDNWDNHYVKEWELIAKWVNFNNKTEDKKVDYLVSSDSDKVIKINSVIWDKVLVQYWDRKDISSLPKEEQKEYKDKNWVLFRLWDEYEITLSELNNYIKSQKLYPDWKAGKWIWEENEQELQNEFHWSFASRLFNRSSINELLAWWTMFVEWFKESIKRWNDLHAAKFALALGSVLPEEIRADLQIKVERQEAEEMDKALEWLGKIDSGQAIARIKGWLWNRDTPEFKKEAWLMFMISKYWVLYAKWPMWWLKWSFLWYEAFWWRINDELYLKVKKDSEEWEPPIPFTEEKLMYELLNKQCKEWWYKEIKRRWRLYKEYDWKISQWITDELAKWSREAQAMRSFKDRNDAAKWEFKWGEFNNGLWKYKEAVNRWAALHDLNELPFILLFSWTCNMLQEEQLNEFKSFTEWWMKFWGLLFTKFLSDSNWMKIFNKTIVDLSEDFEKRDPAKFAWMNDKAIKIFKNQNNGSLSIRDKMNAAEWFWSKYWESLSRTMLKLNNRDSNYLKTDKILVNDDGKYSNYNSTLDSYIAPADFSSKDIMNDQFANQWVSWLSATVLGQIWDLTPGWTFRNWEAAEWIWNEIIWEINNTKSAIYDDDLSKNREVQIKNISIQVSYILTYIKKMSLQWNVIENLKKWMWDIWLDLRKLNLVWHIDELSAFSSNELAELKDENVIKFIRNISIDILDNNATKENIVNDFDDIITSSKNSVNNTMYNSDQENVA